MGFPKMQKEISRQWAVYGDAGSGKSHFASQMKGSALIIDSDARFTEQLANAVGEIYKLSDEHTDNTDPNRIIELLKENLPSSGIRTIVVDSLTAIMRPIINQGLVDSENAKNKIGVWREKALAMSRMQDALSSSGCDVLWIWHTHESRDNNAKLVQRASIPDTELVRLRRSLNVILKLEVDGNGKRSVLIEWARNGNSGIRLVDDAGGWRGMPERIEATIYADGVQAGDVKPTSFTSATDAVAWGFEQGCFRDAIHAQRSYDKCKRESKPANSAAMWRAWIEKVEAYKIIGNMAEAEPDATEQEES